MTRDPFGAAGDFVTAPEISQMFGEMLGVWIGEAWRAAGEPAGARLVELGPGRGTLMSDVLRVGRAAPDFLDRSRSISSKPAPFYATCKRGRWRERRPGRLARRSRGDCRAHRCSLLANEFFDALPARHFVRARAGVAGAADRPRLLG